MPLIFPDDLDPYRLAKPENPEFLQKAIDATPLAETPAPARDLPAIIGGLVHSANAESGWQLAAVKFSAGAKPRAGYLLSPSPRDAEELKSILNSDQRISIFTHPEQQARAGAVAWAGVLDSRGNFKVLARVEQHAHDLVRALEQSFDHPNLSQIKNIAKAPIELSTLSPVGVLELIRSVPSSSWKIHYPDHSGSCSAFATSDQIEINLTRQFRVSVHGAHFYDYGLQATRGTEHAPAIDRHTMKSAFNSLREKLEGQLDLRYPDATDAELDWLLQFARRSVQDERTWTNTSHAAEGFGDLKGFFWASNYYASEAPWPDAVLYSDRVLVLTSDAVLVGAFDQDYKFVAVGKIALRDMEESESSFVKLMRLKDGEGLRG